MIVVQIVLIVLLLFTSLVFALIGRPEGMLVSLFIFIVVAIFHSWIHHFISDDLSAWREWRERREWKKAQKQQLQIPITHSANTTAQASAEASAQASAQSYSEILARMKANTASLSDIPFDGDIEKYQAEVFAAIIGKTSQKVDNP